MRFIFLLIPMLSAVANAEVPRCHWYPNRDQNVATLEQALRAKTYLELLGVKPVRGDANAVQLRLERAGERDERPFETSTVRLSGEAPTLDGERIGVRLHQGMQELVAREIDGKCVLGIEDTGGVSVVVIYLVGSGEPGKEKEIMRFNAPAMEIPFNK